VLHKVISVRSGASIVISEIWADPAGGLYEIRDSPRAHVPLGGILPYCSSAGVNGLSSKIREPPPLSVRLAANDSIEVAGEIFPRLECVPENAE
jgi:hypothetical protein